MSPTRDFPAVVAATLDQADSSRRLPAKRNVKVIALWRHELADARALARRHLSGHVPGSREVVFVSLVNEKPPSTQELTALFRDGIRVVPVSNRYKNTPDGDRALLKAVLDRIKHTERLVEAGKDVRPPNVDAEAARVVKEAYARLRPVTPTQRQEFLDEYHAADQSGR